MVTAWYLLLWWPPWEAGLVLLLYQAPSSSFPLLSAMKKGRLSPWLLSSVSHRLSPSVSTSEGSSSELPSLPLLFGQSIFSDNAESVGLAPVGTWWSLFPGLKDGLGGGRSAEVLLCSSGLQG